MKIFRLVTAIILCLAVLAGIVFAAVNMPKRPCSGYELVVNYDGEYPAVKEADIQQMIEDNHIETIGVPLKDVDLEQIAQHLQENPYIEKVNEVRFSSTRLRIVVTLKNILLHVYAQDGSQYFVDENGFMLPFSMVVTENVPIANGKIPDTFVQGKNVKNSGSNLQRVFRIASYMNALSRTNGSLVQKPQTDRKALSAAISADLTTMRLPAGLRQCTRRGAAH